MKLLLVEPQASGHHIALYAKLILREAQGRGWTVRLLTTRAATESPDFAEMLEAIPAPVAVSMMRGHESAPNGGRLSGHVGQIRRYAAAKAGFREASRVFSPDAVYVINLDHFDHVLGVMGSPFASVPFSGMLMRLTHGRRRMEGAALGWKGAVVERLFDRIVRIPTLRRLAILDEQYFEFLQGVARRGYEKLCLVRDVGEVVTGATSRSDARRRLEIAEDAFVVLLYGSISLRKGVKEVLAAVAGYCHASVTLVVAGRQDEEVRALLEGEVARSLVAAGRMRVFDGYQSQEQERLVFCAADVVWVGYSGNFARSSGVVYQAGSVGLPVLACQSGLLGWRTRRFELGLTIDPHDPVGAGAAIEALRRDDELRSRLAGAARSHAGAHTGEAFGRAICDMIANTTRAIR
jgi:glycosyltransferase involved in cell wall biosynthesis